MMKKFTIFVIVLLSLLVAACERDVAPVAVSDSSQRFQNSENSRIPVDDGTYILTGRVVADVDSLVRQSRSGYWSSTTTTTIDGVPITTQRYIPPIVNGKGFVRLLVQSIDKQPDQFTVDIGDVPILKTTDTKVMALMPGDIVTFKCRVQYENLAAVRENETFNAEKLATWEFDYCRLENPVIKTEIGR